MSEADRSQVADKSTKLSGQVFQSLPGNWTVLRHIDERLLMNGSATFVEGSNGHLIYHERGRIRLDAQREFDAERKYVFAARTDGFAVYFDETPLRLFHEIELVLSQGNLVGDASHLCAADLYASRYEFHPDGHFEVRHTVTGPRKNYTLSTVFAR